MFGVRAFQSGLRLVVAKDVPSVSLSVVMAFR
jgi:hypothetical protein